MTVSVRSDAARRFGPLLGMAVSMMLVLTVLPSALNVPLSNPTTTPEFAPVPPEDDENPPPPAAGNVAGIGLTTGTSLDEGSGPSGVGDEIPGVPPPPPPTALESQPTAKLCVGNPPRQTEDPLSPPCASFFRGDNGGATHPGVTASEVRIVVLHGGRFTRPTSRGSETAPASGCFDLGKPPKGDEDVLVRADRTLQQYFNNRYQAYNRAVRIVACYDSSTTPEGRRAAAIQHVKEYKPFAFLNLLQGGAFEEAYNEVLLSRGVMQFTAQSFIQEAQYRKNAPLLWGYTASLEQQAAKYASFICTKVVNKPVSFSGNGDNGQPRKLGLLRTDDPAHTGLQRFAAVVRAQVEACGGSFAAEATYVNPYCAGCVPEDEPQYAVTNMASFQQNEVTTIIWPGGWEDGHTRAAAGLNYRPEWIMAGDGQIENYGLAQFQEGSVWRHAWLVADVTAETRFNQSSECYLALREADPSFPEADAKYYCGLGFPYEALRQLFSGIQLAGPRLTPQKVEQGFRAIPPRPSDDPATPSCFYEPGDYTCVKDAQASWWDDTGRSNSGRDGCWRMVLDGKRYLAGKWPAGDPTEQQDRDKDRCNGHDQTIYG